MFLSTFCIIHVFRARNMQGFRVTWNNGHQISFAQKWNPWSRDIPYTTFTSHPLYWYTGKCHFQLFGTTFLCFSSPFSSHLNLVLCSLETSFLALNDQMYTMAILISLSKTFVTDEQ